MKLQCTRCKRHITSWRRAYAVLGMVLCGKCFTASKPRPTSAGTNVATYAGAGALR